MKTKHVRFISFVLVIVLLLFYSFNFYDDTMPVSKDEHSQAADSIDEYYSEDLSNDYDLYNEQSLDEVISVIESGTDINEFFYGSVLYGITLDELYDAYNSSKTIDALMEEYTDIYLYSADNKKNTDNGDKKYATAGDASEDLSLYSDDCLSLYASDSSNGGVIKKISDISSVSMGNSLSPLGCSSHGRLHKLTIKTNDGDMDAFCIDIGKSVHTGNIYSRLSKNSDVNIYGNIYYWYMNNKSNNAYAAASLVIWAYNAGAGIPGTNSGDAYDKWYNTYFSSAISKLKSDKSLNADTIKKYISSVVYAVNNGASCTITTWESPIYRNQRLITGNISEIPYNLTFHKTGVNKYGVVLDNALSGATYGIYKSSSCSSSSLLYKYTTDEHGQFTFTGVEKYPALYIKEISPPKDYNINTNVYKLVSGRRSMTAMDIETECGRFCIKKTDSDTGKAVIDNAKTYEESGRYVLFTDKACTSPAKDIYGNYCIIYTGAKVQNMYWKEWCNDYSTYAGVYNTDTGWFYSGYMKPGTYYLKETHAPNGYSINSDVITVKIGATGKYAKNAVVVNSSLTSDKPNEGSLSLYKNVENGSDVSYASVEGAVYYLYAAENITDYSNNTIYKSKEFVEQFPETDENGYAELSDITPGTYYIVEHEAPEGLYMADEVSQKQLEYNKDGSIKSDITIDNATDYGVQVAMVGDGADVINVYDKPVCYGIKINKYTTKSYGESVPLGGAEFGLFDINVIDMCNNEDNLELPKDLDGYIFEEFTEEDWEHLSKAAVKVNDTDTRLITDENGIAESSICIPYGNYVLVEIQTPLNENGEEYLYKAEPVEINIGEKTSAEDLMLEYDIYDRATVYNLSLVKVNALTGEPVKDKTCSFRIFSMDTNEYVSINGEDILYTDSDGRIDLYGHLTSGTYRVEEYEAPEGYMKNDENMIFRLYMGDNRTYISEYDNINDVFNTPVELTESEIKYLSFSDNPYNIRINKVDEENNYLAGAELAVFLADENGNYLKDINDNNIMLTIDGKDIHWISDGESYSISEIPAGYYILSELVPPDNYLIASDIFFSVGIDEGDLSEDDDSISGGSIDYILMGTNDEITMTDRSCGRVSVYKTGEQLKDFEICQSPYGNYYSLIYTDSGLSDVEYHILDTDMNCVATMVTDENGYAISKELPAGNYFLKEVSAPDGYIIDNELKSITINNPESPEYKDNNDSFNLKNKCQEVNIILSKNGTDMLGNEEFLEGAVFGIFCKDSYVFEDKTIQPDSCLGYIVTNYEGVGEYDGRLPEGSYYIKEVSAPDDFAVSDTCYEFEVALSNEDKVLLYNINDGEPIINYKKTGMIEVFKSDNANGRMLAGAEFTIYDMNDNIIDTLITDGNGYACKQLDYGSYYIRETKAPDGYIIDNTIHLFEVNDENISICFELTNDERIKLGVNEWWFTALGIAALLIITGLLGIVFLKKHGKDKTY